YHVAAVKTSTSFSIYVNGVLEDSRTPVPNFVDSNSANLRIGSYAGQGYRGDLNGLVDEVQLFKRGLTAEEIQAIFSSGSAGQCKTPVNQSPVVSAGQNQTITLL